MTKILLSNDLDKSLLVNIDYVPLSIKAKWLNAAKQSRVFIALMFASIFVPVFHFVLVPLFALVVVVQFFRSLKMQFALLAKEQPACIKCGKSMQLPQTTLERTFRFRCNECHSQYVTA